MTAEVFFRGPGLIMVLAAAFAISYFIYIIRRLIPLIGAALLGYLAVKDPPLGAFLIASVVVTWMLFRLLRKVERWFAGREGYAFVPLEPPAPIKREFAEDRAVSRSDRPLAAASRADVAAEHRAWNAMIAEAVALLKEIPATDGRKKKRVLQLGLKAGELREALLAEQRRLRGLGLIFSDKAEEDRFHGGLDSLAPLAAELWTVSQDPAGYKRLVKERFSAARDCAELEVRSWPRQAGALQISYRAADGEETARTVSPTDVQRQGPLMYLAGKCHLRGEYRQFRVDRICELVDMRTGEVLAADEIPAWLARRVGLPPVHA